jgi:hypothetical protein
LEEFESERWGGNEVAHESDANRDEQCAPDLG